MIKEDADRKLFYDGVADKLKQLTRLLEVEPPIPFPDLAFRMALSQPELRRMMRFLGRDHPALHEPLQPNRQQAAATRRRKKRAAAK